MKRDQDGQQRAELKKNITEVHQSVYRIQCLTVRSRAEKANIERETDSKILTEDLDMRKVCAKMFPKEHCL
jgi:hypothetical protein